MKLHGSGSEMPSFPSPTNGGAVGLMEGTFFHAQVAVPCSPHGSAILGVPPQASV